MARNFISGAVAKPNDRDATGFGFEHEENHRMRPQLGDWAINLILRVMIAALLVLPYRWRVPAMGWINRRLVAPIAGYNKRSAANLDLIYPSMTPEERARIIAGVADNMGRTFIENYSARDFPARSRDADLTGPGLVAIEKARDAGQPVLLVTGHFGNYEAPRAALLARGFDVGGLYRPARNKYFNLHYAETMTSLGGPVFAQGRRGTAGFVRHLKTGGFLVLLFDQANNRGTDLPFLGRPARTALSAAQLALRYNALLVPFYGIRQRDGLSFKNILEAPVEQSDAETMTRALNASLEARIADNPEQWLWVHRRWKPYKPRRQRRRAAARTRPGPAA